MKKCIFLIFVSLLSFSSCKKDKFPSMPTIVTGKVVDENDKPIEGYQFQLSGYDLQGLNKRISTYDEYQKTDKNGIYKFSWVISSKTDRVEFQPIGLILQNGQTDIRYSDIYIFYEGAYNSNTGLTGPFKYGTTNTLNYQVRIQK